VGLYKRGSNEPMAEAYAFTEGLVLAQSMGSSSKRIVWRCVFF
jgi:hypothetical protein